MSFDNLPGASQREVTNGEREGKPTHVVCAARSFACSPEELWAAISRAENLKLWFGEVAGQLAQGEEFSITNNASGTILECSTAKSFLLTWEFGDSKSWVQVQIEATDDGTSLQLKHESAMDPNGAVHWNKYGPGATGVGWEMAMIGLDAFLASSGQSIIEAGMTWLGSAPGKKALRNWAMAWGEAHTLSGEEKNIAKQMAERTANFYTGES